eukprot:TRINITY_DN6727_c0_g1_i2.p1 TRINITY_DN6727_c0_g1~~TRINITY_DN6727_c0_g1_i2.p1  ORF type:complete len:339 (-),score=110.28 TRINITY_DN6727_c0_g1_i2:64-1080(-)
MARPPPRACLLRVTREAYTTYTKYSMSQADKEELKKQLNVALSLKNKIKETPAGEHGPLTQQLRDTCTRCMDLAKTAEVEHGRALALEMHVFARLTDLTNKHEEEDEPYTALEDDIKESSKIASEFGDRALENRLLELQANIYLRIGRPDKEIDCIQSACKIQRTVPKMMALLDAYGRKLDSLFSTPKPDTDLLLKYNAEFWEVYLWLREEGSNRGFNKDQFVRADKRRAAHLFKVALYIGSFAGNPLHGGKEEENVKMGMDAFDEAIWVAGVLDNKEYLCAATAHRASILYHKLNPLEKQELLSNLKQMQEKYEPDNNELADLIESITRGPLSGNSS